MVENGTESARWRGNEAKADTAARSSGAWRAEAEVFRSVEQDYLQGRADKVKVDEKPPSSELTICDLAQLEHLAH